MPRRTLVVPIDHRRQPALGPSCHPEQYRQSGSDRVISNYSASYTSLLPRTLRVAEDPPPATTTSRPQNLLDRVRWHLRVKRYSIRTEQSYIDWIRRFILFHKKRHPDDMSEEEIAAFLSHLAINRNVSVFDAVFRRR